MKRIVSVQDISCFGQCSLTVALPILSARGIETAILPSSVLSTHTGGFSDFTCLDLTEEMPKIVNHWISEGIRFDAIYTGYIGDVRQFEILARYQKDLLYPDGKLIVDPAMADYGKLYPALSADIVAGMRELVRRADVILPNLTEASFLLDIPYREDYDRAGIRTILEDLCAMGPDISILTGISFEKGKIGAAALQKSTGAYVEYFTPLIEKNYHGTGDIFSGIAIADLLNGKDILTSLKDACEFVVKSIRNTLSDPNHDYGVKFESVLAQQG